MPENLGEIFRDAASIYEPVEWPGEDGDEIGLLLQGHWNIFSAEIDNAGLAQDLAIAILEAGLDPKHDVDAPDYRGQFRRIDNSLEELWDEKADEALNGVRTAADIDVKAIVSEEMSNELPDVLATSFADLSAVIESDTIFYRSRIHNDRLRSDRFAAHEVGAPPPEKANAGRANRAGEPVLYLASSSSTAIAEVRAWKGAAVAVSEVRIARRLSVVDLSNPRLMDSPFFDEIVQWRFKLAGLLYRLSYDMSKPVMPHEQEILYRPTQLLASLIKSNGYDGFLYPSAAGTGRNAVLFNPADAEVKPPEYVTVVRVACFSEPLHPLGQIYDEGPYDFALRSDAES